MINFRSDNEAGVAPEIMTAIEQANSGTDFSYGDDQATAALERRFRELFETDLAVFPVISGGAANALALAQLCPPYGSVYCHEHAHIHTDECGGPEFFTGGAKLLVLPGEAGKLGAKTLDEALAKTGELGDHECLPSVLSITQATEFGTVYTPAEIAALCETAARAGMGVHMDGARFGNAVATLGCTPAQLTWRCGVDMLSFGATKNGAMGAEALIVFDPDKAAGLGRLRKRAGHLLSKMRFVSAQLLAYLADDLWLKLAANANATATKLAQGLSSIEQIELLYPTQGNEVFVRMPGALANGLRQAGFQFHSWPGTVDVYRLVTSFRTSKDEVQALIDAAQGP